MLDRYGKHPCVIGVSVDVEWFHSPMRKRRRGWWRPAPVGFQYGYQSDQKWWGKLADPPGKIGRRLLEQVPNAQGLFWVDFTVFEVFPAPR
jgi:hypothetical protein